MVSSMQMETSASDTRDASFALRRFGLLIKARRYWSSPARLLIQPPVSDLLRFSEPGKLPSPPGLGAHARRLQTIMESDESDRAMLRWSESGRAADSQLGNREYVVDEAGDQ